MCYHEISMAQRLTLDQKKSFAEHIMQWGNGAFLGLVIAQAVANKPFDYLLAILGFVAMAIAYWAAYLLMKKRR